MMQKIFISTFVLLILAFSSCNKEKSQAEIDDERIQEFLELSNINAEKTASGLYYYVEVEGTGEFARWNSTVVVHYKGMLLNGTVFDTSYGEAPFVTYLPNTILGWQEGIPKFKEGGKGKLFIPSGLGYGSRQISIIPPNSVLIFDIELLGIN